MLATIDAAPLRQAAVRAAKVAQQKATIPILSNVRLSAADGMLAMEANNLEFGVRLELAAEVETPGAVAINAHEFRAFCEVTGGARVRLALDDALFRASAGSRRASFATLPPEDMPPLIDPVEPWEAERAALARAIAFCAPAASTEETRYYLNGVAFNDGHAVSTNGHMLHALPCPAGAETIIPNAHLGLIRELLEAEEAARFGASAAKWSLGAPGVTLTGKCIDANFPPQWRSLAGGEYALGAVVHRDALAEAVAAATLGRASAVVIEGKAGEGQVMLSARRDQGDGAAEAEAAEVGDFRLCLNADYLATTLGVMPAGELRLEADGDRMARLAPAAEGDGRWAVIMTMRG